MDHLHRRCELWFSGIIHDSESTSVAAVHDVILWVYANTYVGFSPRSQAPQYENQVWMNYINMHEYDKWECSVLQLSVQIIIVYINLFTFGECENQLLLCLASNIVIRGTWSYKLSCDLQGAVTENFIIDINHNFTNQVGNSNDLMCGKITQRTFNVCVYAQCSFSILITYIFILFSRWVIDHHYHFSR